MVHQYKNGDYNIVLDVNSGSIHVVDDLAYDMIAMYQSNTKEEICTLLLKKYLLQDTKESILTEYEDWKRDQERLKKEIESLYDEISSMKEEGILFSDDIYENYIESFQNRQTVVKALCLHIAHDCNLACKYCFAEEGEYHGKRAFMSFEVGKCALDFLLLFFSLKHIVRVYHILLKAVLHPLV